MKGYQKELKLYKECFKQAMTKKEKINRNIRLTFRFFTPGN